MKTETIKLWQIITQTKINLCKEIKNKNKVVMP